MSSQDRGGIRFPLVVADDLTGFDRFDRRIAETMKRWDDFRAGIARISQDAGSVSAALKPLSSALDRTAQAQGRANAAGSEATAVVEAQTQAEKDLEKALATRARRQDLVNVADKQGVDISSKIAQTEGIREQALAELAATQRRARVEQEKANIAKERGISLGRTAARQLTVEEEAAKRLEAIQRRQQVQERLIALAKERNISLHGREAKAFDALAVAAERAGKAKREADVRSALLNQGLDSRGRPIPGFAGAKGILESGAGIGTLAPTLLPALGNLPAPGFLTQLKNEIRGIGTELKESDSAGARFLFTFRRLIGVFAVFQAVRIVVNSFREAVVEGIAFNAEMEKVELGIASLIVAVGQVRDSQGQLVEGAVAFTIAQQEARRQVALLRVEALRTSGTLKELAETFQIAIGPGLQAGLNLDDIRKLTVQISQAAAALGVPQNQLSEEIRSLLSGTIQQRTTRIAAALGITNEDIRRAREVGDLVGFLDSKFKAFSQAAIESAANFDILLSNLKDGFQQLLGEGGAGLFKELKGLFADVLTSLTAIGDTGIEINPQAVEIVKGILDGLTVMVAEARAFMAAINPEDVSAITTALGNGFAAIGRIFGLLGPAAISFLGDVANVLNVVADIVTFIRELLFGTDAVGKVMRTIVGLVLQWYLTVKLIGFVSVGIFNVMRAMGLLLAAIQSGSVLSSFAALATPIGIIAAALVTIVGLVRLFSSDMDDAGEATGGAAAKAKSYVDVIKGIPAIVQATNKAIEDNGELVKKLTDDLNKALDRLKSTMATLGASGASAEDIKTLLEIESKLRDEGKSLLTEINVKQETKNKLLEEQLQIQQRLAAFAAQNNGDEIVRSIKESIPLAKEQQRLNEEHLKIHEKLKLAIGTERIVLEDDLKLNEKKGEELQKQLELLRDINSLRNEGQLLPAPPSDETDQMKVDISRTVIDTLKVDQQILATETAITELGRQRLDLITRIGRIQAVIVEENARKEVRALSASLRGMQAQIEAERERAAARTLDAAEGFRTTEGARRLFEARADVIVAKEKLETLKLQQTFEEFLTEEAIRRAEALREEARELLKTEQTAEGRAKLEESISQFTETRSQLLGKLAAQQADNAAKRVLEETKIAGITASAFRDIRAQQTLAVRDEQLRTISAQAGLAAEESKARVLEVEEQRMFRMADAERRLLESQQEISQQRGKIDTLRGELALKEREIVVEQQQVQSALTLLKIKADGKNEATEQVRLAGEIFQAETALVAINARLLETRKANTAELRTEELKLINIAAVTLGSIKAQAAAETLQAQQRLVVSQSALVIEQRRQEILRLDAETGFRLADTTKRLIEADGDVTGARARLDITKQTQAIQEKQIEDTIEQTRAFEASVEVQLELKRGTAEELDLWRQLIGVQRTRTILEASLAAIRSANAQDLVNEIDRIKNISLDAINAIRGEATRAAFDETQAAIRSEAQNVADKQRIEARQRLLLIEQAIGAAQADTGVLEAEIALMRTANELEEERLATSLERTKLALSSLQDQLKNAAPGVDVNLLGEQIVAAQNAVIAKEQELLAVRRENTAELAAQQLQLDQANLKVTALKAIEAEPVALGAAAGFLELYQQATNVFQASLDFTKQAITGFAQVVSGILTDALDPTKDVDIKERFHQFFLGLANTIINFLITLGLVTLALNAIPGFAEALKLVAAFNSATGGGTGLAEGGPVPASAQASAAHFTRPRGFRRGGRPRGLDPRDTVPIWVQPGEFVLREPVVSKHRAWIEAFNAGDVAPTGSAPVIHASAPSRSSNPTGFASGGFVADRVSALVAAGRQQPIIVESQSVQPILPATDATMDELLSGGDGAMKRWVRRNSQFMRTVVGGGA